MKWGTRGFFTVAVLVTLSTFAKDTATVAIDLPQAIARPFTVHAAELPAPAYRSTMTNLPASLGPSLPVFASPVPAAMPAKARSAAHLSAFSRISHGMASWYGKVLQDHRTASGRRFNMFELTAAHRTLPFGSQVKVTNLRNHLSVVVTITDRGELLPERIIDLSYGAAEELDMVHSGVDKVTLEVLPRKPVLSAAAVAPADVP